VTSESHDVSPEPPKAESIAAMAIEESIEAEVTSASTNLAKAPCKCACTKSNKTGSTFECKFLCYGLALKPQVSYTRNPYII
jgi:hypothetical protein